MVCRIAAVAHTPGLTLALILTAAHNTHTDSYVDAHSSLSACMGIPTQMLERVKAGSGPSSAPAILARSVLARAIMALKRNTYITISHPADHKHGRSL